MKEPFFLWMLVGVVVVVMVGSCEGGSVMHHNNQLVGKGRGGREKAKGEEAIVGSSEVEMGEEEEGKGEEGEGWWKGGKLGEREKEWGERKKEWMEKGVGGEEGSEVREPNNEKENEERKIGGEGRRQDKEREEGEEKLKRWMGKRKEETSLSSPHTDHTEQPLHKGELELLEEEDVAKELLSAIRNSIFKHSLTPKPKLTGPLITISRIKSLMVALSTTSFIPHPCYHQGKKSGEGEGVLYFMSTGGGMTLKVDNRFPLVDAENYLEKLRNLSDTSSTHPFFQNILIAGSNFELYLGNYLPGSLSFSSPVHISLLMNKNHTKIPENVVWFQGGVDDKDTIPASPQCLSLSSFFPSPPPSSPPSRSISPFFSFPSSANFRLFHFTMRRLFDIIPEENPAKFRLYFSLFQLKDFEETIQTSDNCFPIQLTNLPSPSLSTVLSLPSSSPTPPLGVCVKVSDISPEKESGFFVSKNMYGEPSRYDNYIFYMKCYLMMVFGGAELYTAEQRAVLAGVYDQKTFTSCERLNRAYLAQKI